MEALNGFRAHSLPISVPMVRPCVGMYWDKNQSWNRRNDFVLQFTCKQSANLHEYKHKVTF